MLEALADEPRSEPGKFAVDDVELSLDSPAQGVSVPWSWKVRLKSCGFQEAAGQAQQAQAFAGLPKCLMLLSRKCLQLPRSPLLRGEGCIMPRMLLSTHTGLPRPTGALL